MMKKQFTQENHFIVCVKQRFNFFGTFSQCIYDTKGSFGLIITLEFQISLPTSPSDYGSLQSTTGNEAKSSQIFHSEGKLPSRNSVTMFATVFEQDSIRHSSMMFAKMNKDRFR